ncbi:MAG: hypothetical protein ACO3VO_00280 [Ilumatobacteraceae bacterium]
MTFETAQVRFRRPYKAYKTDRVYTFAKGVARSLELYGKADVVRDPVIEFATAPEPDSVETAVAPIAKAKRGRRKKQP